MNTNHIALFVHLSETLNFSETSRNLHITQPAVTQAIQALENELTYPLFIRTKRSVTLTDAGKSFYEDAQYILLKLNLAIEKAKRIDDKGGNCLTIGYTGTIFELDFIPMIIGTFHKNMPEVQLYLETSNHNIAKNNLLNERNDIFFTTLDDIDKIVDIEFIKLFDGGFVCVMPKNHRLSNHTEIDWNDLDNETIILLNNNQCPPKQLEIQYDVKQNVKNATYFYSDSIVLSHTMIKAEIGVSIMPNFVTVESNEHFKVVPLSLKVNLSYGIAYKKDTKQHMVKDFIKSCKLVFRDIKSE
jgi:DNA-binding transcriptional LysR family regulator